MRSPHNSCLPRKSTRGFAAALAADAQPFSEKLLSVFRLVGAFLLIASSAGASALSSGQVTPELQDVAKAKDDGVLWAISPTMQPALMLVAPSIKEIDIDVDVIPDGTVVAAHLTRTDAPFFLERVMLSTAALWRFEPDPGKADRHLRIVFALDGREVSDAESEGLKARYERPLTVRLKYVIPQTRRLDRVDGKVPPETCKIHGELMDVAVVPIHYGLPSPEESYPEKERGLRQAYWEAFEKDFPNALEWVGGLCNVQPQTQAEVYVCRTCRKLEREWLQAHPGFAP